MPSLLPVTPIRMDETMTLKLRQIAKSEERSINKQVIIIIRKFIEDYESKYGEIKVNPDDLYE